VERVSLISGKLPIILVAPHGYQNDDENTDLIAEYIANSINCYAVINRGWERSNQVNCFKDKADCNNIHHCLQDVVKDEFLDPIIRFKNRILRNHRNAFIFHIHGMSDRHKFIANDLYMDMVLGFGAGIPDSHSCELWIKDLFLNLLEVSGFNPYEGKKGGSMSGWARSNLNQFFRKWYLEPNVHSMQLELTHELRKMPEMAKLTAEYLSIAVKDITNYKTFTRLKNYKSY
jgi:hypothetical protein